MSSKLKNAVENSSHVKVFINEFCEFMQKVIIKNKNLAPIIEICDIYEHEL